MDISILYNYNNTFINQYFNYIDFITISARNSALINLINLAKSR